MTRLKPLTLRLLIPVIVVIGGILLLRGTRVPLLENQTFSHQVLDRNGKLMRLTLSGDEKYRLYTSLKDMHPSFVEAVLLHEDRHFLRHPGVNPWSLIRAAVNTYGRGTRRMGGSTITMQLARMTSVRGSKTIFGKLNQIGRALYLEAAYSKTEILEAYLNLLPYGANIEGVGAASRIYFNKTPALLTLPESLSLAVIPQNPNHRQIESQAQERGTEVFAGFRDSRQRLLKAWLETHPDDNSAYDFNVSLSARRLKELPFRAPHFTELVMQRNQAREFRLSGKIETTLDAAIQSLVETKLKSYVEAKSKIGIRNAAVMIVDHRTMEVVAMVGSSDYFNSEIEGQVNGATSKRSPGSALKPFAYALALDQGLIHPLTLLKDTPMSFGSFDPENYDRNFSGPVFATDALIKSRNVPAVFLSAQLKAPGLHGFLKSAGVSRLREADFYGLALALGGGEVTMEELVRLYAGLANHGVFRELKYVPGANESKAPRLLSPEASVLTLEMLRLNARNDQKLFEAFVRDSVPVAWKTGTSHGFRDAWTAGVIGPYVIAVWLGNFDGEENPALIGRELAAPLFFNLVDGLKGQGRKPLWLAKAGLNIKKVKVCALSGHLPGEHCKHQVETWFIPGKSPISTCNIHRSISIARGTGLRACDENRIDTKKEVFEFWPSDLLQVFKMAGIPRRSPPAFEKECYSQTVQAAGVPPQITSPKRDVVYSLRVASERDLMSSEMIPLMAVADGDARALHWFVGSEYIGRSEPQKPLLWRPRSGRHAVRVVDDLGRADARQIEVKVTR